MGEFIICPKCGNKNLDSETYCTKCDASLEQEKEKQALEKPNRETDYSAEAVLIKCPNCGTFNLRGFTVCSKCGEDLPASKRETIAETARPLDDEPSYTNMRRGGGARNVCSADMDRLTEDIAHIRRGVDFLVVVTVIGIFLALIAGLWLLSI